MQEPTSLSLLPPLLTLALAVWTRRVVVSLAVGVWCGMTILHDFNPLLGVASTFERGVFAQLAKPSNGQIAVVIVVIGGFVGMLEASGGMAAFASRITRHVRSRASAHLAVLFGGIGIFFSDSGNSLILGPVFSPIFDKLGISREKLAFLLDATSSPVCVWSPSSAGACTSWA